jgi:DNA-binding HxlR family transcriptional regulator
MPADGTGTSTRRPRTYDDPCGVARALNVVGERWALLVVRELLFGPKRFSDLRRGLPTISPNVLSQRLRDLEADGILAQRQAGPPVNSTLYELTEQGRDLEPVLTALGRWGSRTPVHSGRDLSPDALVLALHTTIDPARPRAVGAFVLRLGTDEITVVIDDETISASRAPAPAPTAIIASDVRTLRAVVFGRHHPDDPDIAPHITITGNTRAAHRFLAMFARPR